MFFPVCQNGMLDDMYNLIYRLPFTTGKLIESHSMEQGRIVKLQRVIKIVFGNVVDMGDHVNSHPGFNSAYVLCFSSAILLLETLYCLKGICSSKGYCSQQDEQEDEDKAELGAFTQRVQLLMTLSFATTKGFEIPC